MDPPEIQELRSAGADPDDETMAAKKRSRRVSFAETTAVHVFDRDEDSDTPPGSADPDSSAPPIHSERWDSDDDSKSSAPEDDDDDDDGQQVLFFKDIDSSSPGSAVGSLTSNDDDNFYGPVSASFIRSGRLSESGVSEDNNHDITLDSTAFSLHYRSVVPQDDRTGNSVGSIRTPTGESLSVTPGFKKNNVSGSASVMNNTMSLIVEDPRRYDYGKMSPTLEALVAEVDRSMRPSSPGHVKESGTGEVCIGGVGSSDDGAGGDGLMGTGADQIGSRNPSSDTQGSAQIDVSDNEKTKEDKVASYPVVEDYCKDDHGPTQYDAVAFNSRSSDLLSPPYRKSQDNLNFQSDNIYQNCDEGEGSSSKCYSKFSPRSGPLAAELVIMDVQQQLELESGIRTPTNAVQAFQSSLQGSVSSIRAKRQQLFIDPTVLPQTKLVKSLDREQPPSSLEMEFERHDEKISAIKNQISEFKMLDTPILVNSKQPSSKEDILLFDPNLGEDKVMEYFNTAGMGVPIYSIEKNLISAAEKPMDNQISILNQPRFETPNIGKHSNMSMVTDQTVNLTDTISRFQFPIDGASSSNGHGSSRRQKKVEPKKSAQVRDTSCTDISTRAQTPEYDLSAPQKGHFTPGIGGAIRTSTLLEETRVLSSTPFNTPVSMGLRSLDSLTGLPNNYSGSLLCNSHDKAGSSLNINQSIQNMNIETKKGLIGVRDKLSQSEMFASSCEPILGGAYQDTANVKGSDTWTDKASEGKIMHSFDLVGSILSSSTQDPQLYDYDANNEDILSVQQSVLAQDVDIVQRKRKNGEIILKEKDFMTELSRAQKSQKLLRRAVDNIPGHLAECDNETTDTGGQTTMKNSTDVISKISEAAKELFSTSVYKITLEKIDVLECILSELQAARKYDKFCTALRNNERFGGQHQQRITVARSLQDKLLFEQVKLQLKRAKLSLLQSKAQSCESRHRECQNLKSIFSQITCDTKASQTHATNLCSGSTYSINRNQEVASKKQELEMLDQKITCLVKSFEASCKIKGIMDCDQIIKVLNENLEMRKRCKVIRQYLQLWELSDILKKNDQSEIALNYCNLLCQRFTVNIGQVSSIIANNILNDANIEKNFPKMNAHLAFEFVFNVKGAHKLPNSKCFQQKTLVTSLLLGTLLDVLNEVQVTQREIWNLVCSAFQSQCLGQLELQLCFFNFKNCGKVTLGFDMSCLDCGVYPSKSSELQPRIIHGSQTTLSQSILDEVMGSVQSLQDGRSNISRFCRHISELIQASS